MDASAAKTVISIGVDDFGRIVVVNHSTLIPAAVLGTLELAKVAYLQAVAEANGNYGNPPARSRIIMPQPAFAPPAGAHK